MLDTYPPVLPTITIDAPGISGAVGLRIEGWHLSRGDKAMKSLVCMVILCVSVSIAAAGQPTAVPIGQFETMSLGWNWNQGAKPDDLFPDLFYVRCGLVGGVKDIERPVEYLPEKSIRLNALVPGPGSYECIVVAANTAAGREAVSAPFPFDVTSGGSVGLSVPSNVRLLKPRDSSSRR